MQIVATAEKLFTGSRQEVFETCTDHDNVVKTFDAYGPIPGVVAIEMRDAEPLAAGVTRAITTSDGVTMDEKMLAFEHPVMQQYRWGGELKPPMSWLVRSGTGHWTFSEEAEGTRVQWSYTFELTSVLAWPPTLILSVLFRRFMSRCLDNLAAL